MKVAIVHYWFVGMRGGEKVIEEICKIYPDADIYSNVYDENKVSKIIKNMSVKTTFINKLPFAKKIYQNYLPLMPMALEKLDLSGYDLIISSESGPAKGIISDPDSVHICYCHSPMRYLWDMHSFYSKNTSFLKRFIMGPLLHYLRIWDVSTASRVDHFIANSHFISKRIKKFYNRNSAVIHPPVKVNDFQKSDKLENFYLMVGQLVGYKKIELAVEAFNKNGKELIIIGEGELYKKIKSIAEPNIKILGYKSFNEIKEYYSKCQALIFPGCEDFGMVPIEAMASGRPVIAYRKGGALDYIIDGKTGIFFNEQNEAELNLAIKKFEESRDSFSSSFIIDHSKNFSDQNFSTLIQKFISTKVDIQQ